MSLVRDDSRNVNDNKMDDNDDNKNNERDVLDLHNEFSKMIQPFHFTSATSLLDIMILSGAIISGDAALALINPNHFKPYKLEFLVPSKGTAWLLPHLQSRGYRFNPTLKTDHDDYDHDKLVVLSFIHPISNRSINVIVFVDMHFITCITRFYNTLIMNYVAWYSLVSLYPKWTIKKKGLIVKNSTKTRVSFKKHLERGFELSTDNGALMETPVVHVCKAGYDCPRTRRSTHDEECGFQPFDGLEHDLRGYEPLIEWSLPTTCKFSARTEE